MPRTGNAPRVVRVTIDPAAYAYPDGPRPWVRANMVATVDGSAQDADGVSGSLGGEPDHRAFTIMRSLADVVVVGAGTARAEGYGPITREGLDETLLGDRPAPTLALVTRSLDVPAELRTEGVVVVTTTEADAEKALVLEEAGVEVLRHGADDIDWSGVLEAFAARGWAHVLAEGGPTLLGELLRVDVLDELCLTVAPTAVGGPGPRIVTSGSIRPRPLTLAHALAVDDVLLTRWLRAR